VLLYIEAATELAASCRPEGTCYRCCFALIGRVCFAEEAPAADVAMVKALAVRVLVPANEGILLLTAGLLELLFLFQSIVA
jgi:hypothetical protein